MYQFLTRILWPSSKEIATVMIRFVLIAVRIIIDSKTVVMQWPDSTTLTYRRIGEMSGPLFTYAVLIPTEELHDGLEEV